MSTVTLTEQEWQQVMAIISTAPWRDANPLLMKIGQQLQAQQTSESLADRLRQQVAGNSKQTPEEIQRTLDESAPYQGPRN